MKQRIAGVGEKGFVCMVASLNEFCFGQVANGAVEAGGSEWARQSDWRKILARKF